MLLPHKKKPWKRYIINALLGGVFFGLILFTIENFSDIMRIFLSGDEIKRKLANFGPFAPLLFIAIQFFQVIIFIIPGEVVQVAGGYLFSVIPALFYSLIGIGIGSVFAFMLSRKLGVAFVRRVLGEKKLAACESFLTSRRSLLVCFLLFLIPGIPKDILCYAFGLSKAPVGWFLLLSLCARIPALSASILMGRAIADRDWTTLIIVGSAGICLVLAGIILRKQIIKKIDTFANRDVIT